MFNPLKKLFGNTFVGSLEASVIGIDIGTSSIKIIQMKRKAGKAFLETYGSLELGPYAGLDIGAITNLPAETIAQALTDVIRESGATTKTGALAMPSASSLLFLIELPAGLDEKTLPSVVPIEARKYIPVPITEVTLDYMVIPKDPHALMHREEASNTPGAPLPPPPKTDILIVAVHNDTIERFTTVAQKAAIETEFFEIEAFSSIRSSFGREKGTVLLVDMGASKTKLSVVEDGTIRSFHVVNRGGFDITSLIANALAIPFIKAEEMKRTYGITGAGDPKVLEIVQASIEYILSEIRIVAETYERRNATTLTKVIFTGGGATMKGFDAFARSAFGEKTEIVLATPFAKTEAPAFLEPVLRSTGPLFSVAVGVALRKLEL